MDILDELNKTIKEKKEDWNYTPKREKSETDALIDQLLLEFASESKPGEPIKKMKSYSSQYDAQPESYERREYSQPQPERVFTPPPVEVIPVPEPEPESEYIPEPELEYQPEYTPQPEHEYVPKHEAPPKETAEVQPDKAVSEPYDDHTRVFSREEIEREIDRMEETTPDDDGYEYEADSTAQDTGSTGSVGNDSVNGGFGDDYYDESDFEKELGDISSDKLDEKDRDEFEEFIGGQDEDKIRVIKPREKKKTGKKILRILATAVVAAFTIIGIFSSAIYCLEKLEMMPTEKEEKEESMSDELADVIQPFVMTSVDDFDNAEKISNEQLINLAIWEIVIHGDVKFFKDDETSKIIIPQKQVELAAENLVGETKEIEPEDIAFSGLEIKYDSEKEGYILPENYYVLTTYPEVTGVTEENGTYAINVSCFRDTPHWMDGKKSSPVKKMTFTLKKTGSHYQVLSAITV